MNITYIGNSHPSQTSYHRYTSLQRLGHNVVICDPYETLASTLNHPIIGRFHYYSGYKFLQNKVVNWIRKNYSSFQSDVIWVDNGELFGLEAVTHLKSLGGKVILYNTDDPTGNRDHGRFKSFLKALSKYDLIVTVREPTLQDLIKLNAQNAIKVYRSYDEVVHKPPVKPIPDYFKSDVAFIGTWIRHEKRDLFLLELINQGINVSIWGDNWSKSPQWQKLKPYYKGSALFGENYVNAIAGAKVNLGLLSKGNRDLHTTRSMEIPYAGGLFCAERTTEHLALYKEGEEAVFWSTAEECIEICHKLLQDADRRDKIRKAGQKKVIELKLGNEDICKEVLSHVAIKRD
ncbi:CgeB family protein [Runella limosa]|uniref:CgeB family protein n=1 Tax=Runella limosa TaxID=370978 RepID=UPI0003F649D6|nr:glycosyltransferase [Runella limosa]